MTELSRIRSKSTWLFIGLYAFFFLLFLLAVRSGDDLGRTAQFRLLNSEGENLFNTFFTFHQSLNGRVLGNAFHLFLIDFPILNALVRAAISTGILWAVMRLSRVNYLPIVPLIAMLTIAPSVSVFKQVTVWSAGYYNYVVPVLLLLLLVVLIRDGRGLPSLLAIPILSVAAALFAENVTLIVLVVALATCGFSLWTRQFNLKYLLATAGSLVGAFIMFSSPVYSRISAGEDRYREIAGVENSGSMLYAFLNRVAENAGPISKSAALEMAPLYLAAALALALAIRFWRSSISVVVLTTAMLSSAVLLYLLGLVQFEGLAARNEKILALATVLVLLGYFCSAAGALFFTGDRNARAASGWLAFGALLLLPFLVVSPFGPRNTHFTVICLIIGVLTVASSHINRLRSIPLAKVPLISAFAIIALVVVSLLGMNKVVELENDAIVAEATADDTRIVLRPYPVPSLVQDRENQKKQIMLITGCFKADGLCDDIEIVWE